MGNGIIGSSAQGAGSTQHWKLAVRIMDGKLGGAVAGELLH